MASKLVYTAVFGPCGTKSISNFGIFFVECKMLQEYRSYKVIHKDHIPT